MQTSSLNVFRAAIGCAALIGAGTLAVMPGSRAAAAPLAAYAAEDPPALTIGGLSRTITIEGRRVRISVGTWVDLMPGFSEGTAGQGVGASVNLNTVNGRNLPIGLTAERLLLERGDDVGPGERRTWNPALRPHLDLVFDPTSAGYSASNGPAWEGGTPCNVVVRLRNNGRVIRVQMGSLNLAEVY